MEGTSRLLDGGLLILSLAAALVAFNGESVKNGDEPFLKRVTRRGWISLSLLLLTFACSGVKQWVDHLDKASKEQTATLKELDTDVSFLENGKENARDLTIDFLLAEQRHNSIGIREGLLPSFRDNCTKETLLTLTTATGSYPAEFTYMDPTDTHPNHYIWTHDWAAYRDKFDGVRVVLQIHPVHDNPSSAAAFKSIAYPDKIPVIISGFWKDGSPYPPECMEEMKHYYSGAFKEVTETILLDGPAHSTRIFILQTRPLAVPDRPSIHFGLKEVWRMPLVVVKGPLLGEMKDEEIDDRWPPQEHRVPSGVINSR